MQRDLGWGFAAQAGYVGSRHVRPLLTLELNYAEPGQGNAGRILNRQFGRTAGTSVRRPLATNHYESLQSTLTRRFSGCCQLMASYTFSKSISYSGDWASPAVFYRNRALSAYAPREAMGPGRDRQRSAGGLAAQRHRRPGRKRFGVCSMMLNGGPQAAWRGRASSC